MKIPALQTAPSILANTSKAAHTAAQSGCFSTSAYSEAAINNITSGVSNPPVTLQSVLKCSKNTARKKNGSHLGICSFRSSRYVRTPVPRPAGSIKRLERVDKCAVPNSLASSANTSVNNGDVVPRTRSPMLYTNPFPNAMFWA